MKKRRKKYKKRAKTTVNTSIQTAVKAEDTDKHDIVLRDYQQECIDSIPDSGRYLIQMPTGCGKTATFTHIPRRGRVLVLAHREELVNQPIEYHDCPVGIEMASQHSHGEEVVIASVQTLVRRLDQFSPERAFERWL